MDVDSSGRRHKCPLTVTVDGQGTVTSTESGIQYTCTGSDAGPVVCTQDYAARCDGDLTTADSPQLRPRLERQLQWLFDSPCMATVQKPASVGVNFLPRICSPDGWCWIRPLPQGDHIWRLPL